MKLRGKLSRDNDAPVAADPVATITAVIQQRHQPIVEKLQTLVRHPRSLARSRADWRPPSLRLPGLSSESSRASARDPITTANVLRKAGPLGTPAPDLCAAVSRHRVGPVAQQRIRAFASSRTAVYLVSIRITQVDGGYVNAAASEAWIRSLVGDEHRHAVHEISTGRSLTYLWTTDARFNPIPSPLSMFEGYPQAA